MKQFIGWDVGGLLYEQLLLFFFLELRAHVYLLLGLGWPVKDQWVIGFPLLCITALGLLPHLSTSCLAFSSSLFPWSWKHLSEIRIWSTFNLAVTYHVLPFGFGSRHKFFVMSHYGLVGSNCWPHLQPCLALFSPYLLWASLSRQLSVPWTCCLFSGILP